MKCLGLVKHRLQVWIGTKPSSWLWLCTQWIWRHQLRIREPAEGDPVTAVTAACGGRRKMTGSRKILLLGVLARLLSTAPVPLSPAPERTRARECVNHVVSTELQCPLVVKRRFPGGSEEGDSDSYCLIIFLLARNEDNRKQKSGKKSI